LGVVIDIFNKKRKKLGADVIESKKNQLVDLL